VNVGASPTLAKMERNPLEPVRSDETLAKLGPRAVVLGSIFSQAAVAAEAGDFALVRELQEAAARLLGSDDAAKPQTEQASVVRIEDARRARGR